MPFTALYGADVLRGAPLRDLLLRLGQTGLFRARWTEQILDEMLDGVRKRRPELDPELLTRTREILCDGVPDCLVTGYEPLVDGLTLPEPSNRHVLAAAIRCSAGVIVTSDVADFPAEMLEPFNVEAQSPDRFVLHLLDLAPGRVAAVVQQQATASVGAIDTVEDLLGRLGAQALPRSVAVLRAHLGL